MQGPGNLFVGTTNSGYHFFYENIGQNHLPKYSEVKWQTDDGQTNLRNILVKNVLNEMNKAGVFSQGFKDSREIKRKVSQNLDDLQNLLIKLTVKESSEKALLLYEFPSSLNPGDKLNDAQAWKNY